MGSAASWKLFPAGSGWLIFATSDITFAIAGETDVPPPWQVMQFCVTASYAGATGTAGRNNRAGDCELCDMWQDMHAFTPTVAYGPAYEPAATWFVAVR